MFEFFKRYENLNIDETTSEEEDAGINIFDKYGFFNILYALTKGDVSKYNQFLELPADDIFMTLSYEKDKRKYEKKLREIYNQEKK